MALRPCLSAGLLFSDTICADYNKFLTIPTFHFSNIGLQVWPAQMVHCGFLTT